MMNFVLLLAFPLSSNALKLPVPESGTSVTSAVTCAYGMKCQRRAMQLPMGPLTKGESPMELMHKPLSMDDMRSIPDKYANMLAGLPSSEKTVFSQNGEDGVLEHIFSAIEPKDKFYVEFGVQDCSECNTRFLRTQYNWTGLLMDGGHEDPKINLRREMIFKENIVSLFEKYGVPFPEFDMLSVDVDMTDFWVTHEILSKGYRPRVIVNEVNAASKLRPPAACSVSPDAVAGSWDGTDYFGASVSAFASLYQKFGYSMVYCESRGVNCFGVRDDVVGARLSAVLAPGDIYRQAAYGPNNGGHPADRKNRSFVDVMPYLQ